MALHETNREDLFAEGTAFTTRIELLPWGETEPLVAGCRRNGAWSIYFGAEPCYHFDPQGRLRRAFVDDRLYRTQGETLARLTRVRGEDSVELERTDLSPVECAEFLSRMHARIEELQRALRTGQAVCRRRFPDDCDVAAMLAATLGLILADGPRLAPPIPTRRN